MAHLLEVENLTVLFLNLESVSQLPVAVATSFKQLVSFIVIKGMIWLGFDKKELRNEVIDKNSTDK